VKRKFVKSTRGRSRSAGASGVRRFLVPVEELRWVCDPAQFEFASTKEVKPYDKIMGQEKAVRALSLGLSMTSPGYHVFICGAPGTGRKTTLRHLLNRAAREPIPPVDRIYVPRFDIPERPKLVTLPAGRAKPFKRDVSAVFTRLQRLRDRQQDGGRRGALKKLVSERLPRLARKYRKHADLVTYFRHLGKVILERDGDALEDDFGVQIVIARRPRQRAPVLWPTHLTFSGLFGSFEKQRGDDKRPAGIPVGGIRVGVLAEASDGYLVIQANELLEIPHAWNALKSCLINQRLDLYDSEGQALFSAPNSRPDSIPLNVKVILIGDYSSYDSLFESDSEFARVFKIRVDFDVEVPVTRKLIASGYPRVLAGISDMEKLRHLSREAVAKVIEYAVRRAGRKSKISIEFSAIADLLREANFWAERARRRSITEADVEHSIRESIGRLNMLETKISEMIAEGVILIDTGGSRVGQVNGLAVYDQGDYQFGKPSRITAETAMGHGGIINIERESGLSGRSHDKGIQILGGYLRSRFAQHRPLSLTASVCFEQSYSGVDGDSASSTEIYAILSSLSGLPIRQDVAVTGSVNQKGDIQPIGGVNEKIEGFFDCVRAGAPTGKEGVIIPRRNIPDLMLREDVVAAVDAGRFAIYAIDTVEEGIEILTGCPAGERRQNGEYAEGSVFWRVDRRLDEIARKMKDYPTVRD
jgi:ATP-dependent Lon protease